MATAPSWGFNVREFQKGSKQFLGPDNSPARNLTNKNACTCAPGTLAFSLFCEHTRHTPTSGHLYLQGSSLRCLSSSLPSPPSSSLCSNVALSRQPTYPILFILGTLPHPIPGLKPLILLYFLSHNTYLLIHFFYCIINSFSVSRINCLLTWNVRSMRAEICFIQWCILNTLIRTSHIEVLSIKVLKIFIAALAKSDCKWPKRLSIVGWFSKLQH